jgi:hypothetical protein
MRIVGALALLLICAAAISGGKKATEAPTPIADHQTVEMLLTFDQRLKELRDNPQARQDLIDRAEREHWCVDKDGCK